MEVCNSCQKVNNFEVQNNNADLYPTEEEYNFKTSYFVKSSSLGQ